MNTSKYDRNIKILMYHRIVEKQMKDTVNEHAVCVDDFRNQLKMLEILNFTPITFMDYKLYLEDKLTLPKNPIILTFDDGYLDTFELAIPALIEFDMRAVIFVMGDRTLKTANWDEEDGGELMTNDQVLTASSMGFEIGAHSMNHKVLTELSEIELREEIMDSLKSIESVLGKRIQSFAYPYGCTDKRVNRVTRECGFTFGCGVYTGPPAFGDDFFDFRRLAINKRTSFFRFLIYLLTPYQYVEWIYAKGKNQVRKQVEVNNREFKKASLFGQSIHE
jgi:peptidoglycan/xylan/chitin deacetylase (PgdA/CDA1 family)